VPKESVPDRRVDWSPKALHVGRKNGMGPCWRKQVVSAKASEKDFIGGGLRDMEAEKNGPSLLNAEEGGA